MTFSTKILGIACLVSLLTGVLGMYLWVVTPLKSEVADLKVAVKYQEDKSTYLTEALMGTQSILKDKDKEVKSLQGLVGKKDQTTIQYIERPIDPSTGKKDDTLVDYTTTSGTFKVGVNGKQVDIPMVQGEKYAFQDGKVVINQTSTGFIDIKMPKPEVIENKWAVSGWATNKAAGVEVDYKRLGITYGKDYSDGSDVYGAKWVIFRGR